VSNRIGSVYDCYVGWLEKRVDTDDEFDGLFREMTHSIYDDEHVEGNKNA